MAQLPQEAPSLNSSEVLSVDHGESKPRWRVARAAQGQPSSKDTINSFTM
jgi:hypothetical protein